MDELEFQRGVNEAQVDIAVNRMRYYCQTRGSWGEKFTELMRDRFRVQVIHVSDMTCDTKISYEEGYNTTIKSHIEQAFESAAFDRTWTEIDAFRQESYRRRHASPDGA